ncbi:SDR family oxidoreductase [Fibrella aquatilis]|uniref:SDR family NAD(P)-dependent oxidoreductase n=1 Tax=Fibrella aquatilis TaxID=2817059 RepID=A0A939G8V0_9BACT|nr:SDR family NAD(P)-dependent oxidoreductase [Fibrella aquatilis]MBO0931938.1 SDR family NAD(P)-dependent oxidoreductase [Fibrella aquatilis]
MNLTKQHILLTGGTSGIGLALLRDLHQRGNRLVVVARDANRADELRQTYPDVVFLSADLASENAVVSLLDTLRREHPNLTVLINNAGVQFNYNLADTPHAPTRIETEIRTNLTSVIQLCAGLLPGLLEKSEGVIINITSGLGISPKRSAPVYSASKAALQNFTKGLRYQVAGTSVQVVDVVLPLVDTPMTARRGRGKISPEQVSRELIRGVERGQQVVNVGKVKLFRLIHRLAPALADRILRDG